MLFNGHETFDETSTKTSLRFMRNVWIKYALFNVQMNALKNLGLNVVKASVCLDSTGKHNKFAITKA